MAITEGSTPGINITPAGVGTIEGGESTFTGGGGKWSWLDTLWTRLKDWFWIGGIGIAVLLGLYFLVSAAKPIIGGIFRAIASIFPIIGSLVENAVAKVRLAKPLAEVVDGGETFKALVDKEPTFTPEVKAKVLELFAEAHNAAQDKSHASDGDADQDEPVKSNFKLNDRA
jgi:hypothetical protein